MVYSRSADCARGKMNALRVRSEKLQGMEGLYAPKGFEEVFL